MTSTASIMTPSTTTLKAALVMMVLLLATKSNDAFQRAACAKSNAGPIMMKKFVSPLNMFREFDEFFDRPVFSTPGFDRFLPSPPGLLFQPRLVVQKNSRSVGSRNNQYSLPGHYEVNEEDDKFHLAIDVPGIKVKDINVQVKQDGRILRITGERKRQEGNLKSERKIEKSFALDKNIDTEKITADLSDGVIVITMPKKVDLPKSILQIPIVENASLEPVVETTEADKGSDADHENAEDNKFHLAIDVPGIKAKDINVQVEQDGRILRITGERKFQEGNLKSERKIEKSFALDKNIQTEKITANLSDGVIVITMPKKVVLPKSILQIPIVENTRLEPVVETTEADKGSDADHENAMEEHNVLSLQGSM